MATAPTTAATIPTTAATAPISVIDADISVGLPDLPATRADGQRVHRVWLLVRAFTEPLGIVSVRVPAGGLARAGVAAAVDAELGSAIRARIDAAGGELAGSDPLPTDGVPTPVTPPFLAQRERVHAQAPPITVVVCTREHPEALTRTLDSLLDQEYPATRILVVDNAPVTPATARVVAQAATRGPVEYLREERPGLSHARNAAVAAAPGQILAWTDDDVITDRYWLSEIARALVEHPEADVISGVIVPAELETPAQVWFEQFGGHSKGRGFAPAAFGPGADPQDPLYPLPPFGTGANMVFRPEAIAGIGGFDAALGAGTPAMGSEDTLAFTQVLRRGGTIVYQPTALVRHVHRRDLAGLRRQLVGYGCGLSAAYTSLVLAEPRVLFRLLRLLPTALRDLFGADTPRASGLRADFPTELLGANRRGMVRGPLAYLRGRWANRAAKRERRA